MVEIRVNRGGRIQNRPIGVANVNTGRAQAYSEIARDQKQIADTFFDISKTEFAKAGVEEAQNVEILNEKGEIDYAPIEKNFLIGAKGDAYKTVLRDKYATALENDLVGQAQELQAQYRTDPDGFNTAFIEGYVAPTKDLLTDIDPELANQYTKLATKYNASAQSKIRVEQIKRETNDTIFKANQSITRNLGSMRNAIANGADPSLYYSEASNQLNSLFESGVYTAAQYKAGLDQLNLEARSASVNKVTADSNVLQLNSLSLYLNEAGVNPERLDAFPEEQKQEIIELFEDATPDDMRKIENIVSQRKTAIASEESATNSVAFAKSAIETGVLIDDTKNNRQAVGAFFAENYGSPQQIAQNPEAREALARATVIPENIKQSVESGLKARNLDGLPDPREFFVNLELATMATENNRKSFSTEAYAEVSFLRDFLQQYGTSDENLRKGLTEYFNLKTDTDKRNKILDNLRSRGKFTNKQYTDTADTLSNSALLNAFIETLAEENEDINRQALQEFAPAVLPLVAFGYDDAEATFKKLYKQNYGESKFFRVDDRTSEEQLYPPEQMFGADGAVVFEEQLTSLVSETGFQGELGKDYFIVTNPRSTQSAVEYNIIDANGVQMEENGEKMTINSQALTGYFEMQRRKRVNELQEMYENIGQDKKIWLEKILESSKFAPKTPESA